MSEEAEQQVGVEEEEAQWRVDFHGYSKVKGKEVTLPWSQQRSTGQLLTRIPTQQ